MKHVWGWYLDLIDLVYDLAMRCVDHLERRRDVVWARWAESEKIGEW